MRKIAAKFLPSPSLVLRWLHTHYVIFYPFYVRHALQSIHAQIAHGCGRGGIPPHPGKKPSQQAENLCSMGFSPPIPPRLRFWDTPPGTGKTDPNRKFFVPPQTSGPLVTYAEEASFVSTVAVLDGRNPLRANLQLPPRHARPPGAKAINQPTYVPLQPHNIKGPLHSCPPPQSSPASKDDTMPTTLLLLLLLLFEALAPASSVPPRGDGGGGLGGKTVLGGNRRERESWIPLILIVFYRTLFICCMIHLLTKAMCTVFFLFFQEGGGNVALCVIVFLLLLYQDSSACSASFSSRYSCLAYLHSRTEIIDVVFAARRLRDLLRQHHEGDLHDGDRVQRQRRLRRRKLRRRLWRLLHVHRRLRDHHHHQPELHIPTGVQTWVALYIKKLEWLTVWTECRVPKLGISLHHLLLHFFKDLPRYADYLQNMLKKKMSFDILIALLHCRSVSNQVRLNNFYQGFWMQS